VPLLKKQFGVIELKLRQQTTWSEKTMKEHKSSYSHQWKACYSMNRRKESYNLLMGEETKT
jgi:hypothetical protein